MLLTREDFVGVVTNAIAGLGFDQDVPMVTFPVNMFLVGSDITAIERQLDEFVAGLTQWRPKVTQPGLLKPAQVSVEGQGYRESAAALNRLFLKNRWGDGLPLLPPTEDAVAWILQGSDRARDEVVGKFLPRGGIVTIETAAVALAMAGGRPEYLPVLLAAVQAIFDPGMDHDKWQATSASTFPVVAVNGPMAPQIRLNSGFGLLGPDPAHPAGAGIGRALRLLQQNVGGALPGFGTMALFGGMRYTNAVFAEDEAGLPQGWAPHHVERLGHTAAENVVTVYPATSAVNIVRRGTGKETPDEEAEGSLHRIAGYLRAPNVHYLWGYEEGGTPGALLLPRVVARQLAGLGWTKTKVREFLWEHSRIPLEEVKRTGLMRWLELESHESILKNLQDPMPICRRPEQLILLVAGGGHPTHAYWMPGMASKVVARPIELPRRWEALLKAAEQELGEPV
ncbi:MAG: hypothetical protein HY423_02135 [Candidatus Lambdaproteobacteria bacterium]|nr:hypothetical protein [Candidatus Lambdaproteobacteria bacterium]